jgi:S-adenosylmethionine:tRNA ribosyltransferase-isomerase
LRTDDFDYDLPRELIAQHPPPHRDESRLLVLDRAADTIERRQFPDIADYLEPGDLLVLNDTKVIAARLVGHRRTGGRVEFLLIAPEEGNVWRAMLKRHRHPRPGEVLSLEGGAVSCTFREEVAEGQVLIEFDLQPPALLEALEKIGRAPLPPYIKRPDDDPDRVEDRERYQTVYARRPGAIAAPTAGLHFTPEVFARLDAKGVRRTTLTLHVGLGTFKPVKTDRVEDHVMHAEWFELPEEAARAIAETREAGRRVVPVGTTATRVLETVVRQPEWGPTSGWTDLFIAPGFEFRLTDALITNFHLPRSTLLMLVAAFAGRERILAAYEEAKRRGYRFFSYGDAMLIL